VTAEGFARLRRLAVPGVVGIVGAVAVTLGLWLALDFSPLIAGGLGIVIGGGGAALAIPAKPDPEPTDAERIAASLDEIRVRAVTEGERIRGLRSPLWREGETGASAKRRLMAACEQLHGVASLPDIVARTHVDGDILLLHAIATETLPNVIGLAVENDRMYPSASPAARSEISALAEGIGEQARILAEAIGRIESDVVAGTSRDIRQHLEYVRARFAKLDIEDSADFDRAFRELEA
jgi:hypothetical protein